MRRFWNSDNASWRLAAALVLAVGGLMIWFAPHGTFWFDVGFGLKLVALIRLVFWFPRLDS